jgi:hypothetical protein
MKYIITEEQILRFKKLTGNITEDVSEKLMNLIVNDSPVTAAKLVSGYRNLLKLLGGNKIPKETKLKTIKEFLNERGGMSLFELMAEPIHIKEIESDGEDTTEIHQIEFLGSINAIVQIWGGYDNGISYGEYGIRYENLDDDILDEIFEIIIDDLLRGTIE